MFLKHLSWNVSLETIKKHWLNVSFEMFSLTSQHKRCFLWDTEKMFQNKCLLNVYIESVK